MLRCRDFLAAFCLLSSALRGGHRVSAAQYSSNMFLNGEYKNSISAQPETHFSVNAASNIFLNHAIISRQASPFQGPTYLPPREYLKCGNGQQCVRQNQCQSGYFTQLQPKIQNCNPETDVCCTYRPPPTTTTTTPKPFITCNKDSDCVSAKDCRDGEIVASDYIKKTVSNVCYAPEVCCRMPSTTLTSDGYILHKPDKSFPLPSNPTIAAQRTTQPAYRPAPSQTNTIYQPQPQPQPTPAPTTSAPYRPQPTTQFSTYRPQSPEPTREYLPPQTTGARKTPAPAPPTRPVYPQPQPTQPAPPPYRPQPTQAPTYRPQPTNEYLPPQTTASRPRPQPSYPQPTQAVYRPQPQPQPQPSYRPVQPEYLPPSPTVGRQPPPPRPQPTQPVYRPQPSQSPRPQPTQPSVYRPRPTQSPRPQPAYRPQTPNNQYLPPDSLNEIDRQPEPSNINPVQRGEDQLSPQIFPTPKTAPKTVPQTVSVQGPKNFAKCASALVCTAENYCNSIGVISETPVELSSYNANFRVPLTDCLIAETGAAGKCCRDPNYVDPWPVNLAGVCANRNKNTKPTGIKDIDANFAEIPWQAMVLKESTKSLLCGGAIIGDEFVLTTASCVSGVSISDVRVKAGEWELGSTSEPLPFQLTGAKTIDIHPEYNPSTGANDMAIIRLQKRFEFATHIQPICISDEDPSPSEQCITTGWGKQALQIHEEGAIMHVTNTSPLSRSDCGAEGTSVCSSTKFDSCEFDSGSALACGTGSSVRLKGIYTAENACGENQAVRFSKPDIKWINTAFVDRNKPLLLKRV